MTGHEREIFSLLDFGSQLGAHSLSERLELRAEIEQGENLPFVTGHGVRLRV